MQRKMRGVSLHPKSSRRDKALFLWFHFEVRGEDFRLLMRRAHREVQAVNDDEFFAIFFLYYIALFFCSKCCFIFRSNTPPRKVT